MLASLIPAFDPAVTIALLAASFFASFITVALGIGGGAFLIAIMASLMPPAALIPVHGVIQLGSNALRAGLLLPHAVWPHFPAFALGSLAGALTGGTVVVNLPSPVVMIGIGLFVIWNVFAKPPRWLAEMPFWTGIVSSFLTMFFGATGLFVANFVKSLSLERQPHVATHAVLMTLQHLLKVVVFGILGFAFGPWLWFIVLMIVAGFLGTISGRIVLNRMTDKGFKRALDAVLLLLSINLIWQGVAGLL